jgi:EAL domain-containing protein (putative c-di-GMP-specific phosphodiesterase class I)
VITSMDLGEPDDGGHREALQRSMAAGLLGLGKGLGLTVVAEGVDNVRRLQQLRRLGFDLAQGNVIAAPVEAGQLVDLLPG